MDDMSTARQVVESMLKVKRANDVLPLAESATQIESCTDRLFFGRSEVDRKPHRCAECGEEHPYTSRQVLPGKFIYQREPCLCERTEIEADAKRRMFEMAAKSTMLLREPSRLVGKLARMTFRTFRSSPGSRKAWSAAHEMALNWPFCGKGLIFHGGTGRGKTHLAAAIGNDLIERFVGVEFWPVFELLQEIRRSYDMPGSESSIWERMSRVKLLILDDLGNERISADEKGDWAREQLMRIIYRRDIHELPIVVTTNLTVDELIDKLGGPVVSRLLGMCTWCEVGGDDFRMHGAQ